MSRFDDKYKSQYEKVRDFHKAFNVGIGTKPTMPKNNIRDLRVKLLSEEFNEYLRGEDGDDLSNIAKELADILYIVNGTALSYGIPLDEVFNEVHESNMSKLGDDGKPVYREDGKVLKGPNYSEPDIDRVLAEQWDKYDD